MYQIINNREPLVCAFCFAVWQFCRLEVLSFRSCHACVAYAVAVPTIHAVVRRNAVWDETLRLSTVSAAVCTPCVSSVFVVTLCPALGAVPLYCHAPSDVESAVPYKNVWSCLVLYASLYLPLEMRQTARLRLCTFCMDIRAYHTSRNSIPSLQ